MQEEILKIIKKNKREMGNKELWRGKARMGRKEETRRRLCKVEKREATKNVH